MTSKSNHITRFLIIPLVLLISLSLQFCKSAQNTSRNTAENLISYEASIAPLMTQSCTPCHFPEKGRKKLLNTYKATKKNINDILHRIQLHTDNKKFMPYKSKKAPLTKEEINLFKQWMAQNMPK